MARGSNLPFAALAGAFIRFEALVKEAVMSQAQIMKLVTSIAITAVGVAVIFRIPQIRQLVIGS